MLFNLLLLLLHNNKRIKNLIKYRFIVLFFYYFNECLHGLISVRVKIIFCFFFLIKHISNARIDTFDRKSVFQQRTNSYFIRYMSG